MIHNPILPGFCPDPCICRRGEDFYIACSTFEWMPGVPIYRSRDLSHWELYAHALTDDESVGLVNLPSAKGVWAPCLTWCEEDGLFYLVYGVMRSMNARYFDVDNYLITAPDVRGPWSEPDKLPGQIELPKRRRPHTQKNVSKRITSQTPTRRNRIKRIKRIKRHAR